jgi:Leucine-rich repeat (LRR) protein
MRVASGSEISLSYNPIRDLSPLAALSQLDTLRLDSADLDDLSPLRANGLLRVLKVDSNRIRDLSPLSASIAHNVLHARHNLIESLNGLTLPEPRCGGSLELVGNPLDESDVDALCAARWVIRYGDPLEPNQCNEDCLQ